MYDIYVWHVWYALMFMYDNFMLDLHGVVAALSCDLWSGFGFGLEIFL